MKFRNNGAIGALLDEYEKTLQELLAAIEDISDENLVLILDTNTKDEDCQSIQQVLAHIVQSGYTYVVEVRRWLGESCPYRKKVLLANVAAYKTALKEMFVFNEQLFVDYPNLNLCEYDNAKKIAARWGQCYDVEQLFEHAIVHILRHRRQIEKFRAILAKQ